MKKFFMFTISALTVLFWSCSNIFDKGGDEARDSADGGTYLVIGSASVARTLDTDSADSYLSKLTGIVLKGTRTDADGKTEDEITLVATDSLAELTKDGDNPRRIPIQTGTWSFTLTASLDDVEFSDTKNAFEIKAGEVNTISFNLKAQTYGGMSITVAFDADPNLTKVIATLKKPDDTAVDEITIESADFTQIKEDDELTGYSVTYSRSASSESERLASGTYHLTFDFYAEGTTIALNTLDYYVRVSDGITTKYTQKVKLNETYTITYEKNGGELPENTVLPGKYSRKSETIILPSMENADRPDLIIEKTDWIFDGWYTDPEFRTGKKLETIPKGSSGNLELYAKWHERKTSENEFTVSINVNQSDIDVTNNSEDAIKDKIPEITFTAPTEVDGNEITSYEWTLDGKAYETTSSITIDASSWLSSIYTLSLVAKDSAGTYYSYLAQIEWMRLYNIEFNTENNPSITTIPSQYVREGDGITFAATPTYGWYTDAGFTTPFNDDDKPTSNLTLYGCWDLDGKIYVSEDGADPTDTANSDGRGTAGRPFASISAALELVNDAEKAYTIFIDGELTGAQELGSSLDGKAQSITLRGKNGSETDILNGGFSEEIPGTTLTIGTSIPVTIKDLTITGGYNASGSLSSAGNYGGGINVADGGELTLENGAVVTKNTGSFGGGINAVTKSGGTQFIKINIKDGAVISGNTATKFGGGVYAETVYNGGRIEIKMDGGIIGGSGENAGNICNDTTSGSAMGVFVGGGGVALFGAESVFTMSGGVIEGNSAVKYGGGVCVSDGAEFLMTDGELKNNKTTGGDGGGVCVTQTSTFKITGGTVSGNTASGNGKGVCVVNEGAQIPTFKMGGDAVVDSGNDVYLPSGAKIRILGVLSGDTTVATITPATYSDTTTVLEVSTVTEEGMTSTTLENEYGKFAVTPEGTKNWYIHRDGTLITDIDVTSIASQIKAMTESGTVTVRGKMQDSDLATIASAVNSVSSGVLVTLDMKDVMGLTEIPKNTFTSCSKLQSITIPEGVTNIGYCAFRLCGNLTSITLPDSLKSIATEAIESCSNLQTVNLGNGVETLEAGAFNSCTSLTEIHIPASLKTINFNGAFRKCVNLKNITVAEGSEYFEAENGILFNKGKTALFAYPSCTGEYDVPDTVTKITGAAFNGSGITAINLNKTETIEVYVFEGCTGLTSITFPDSLTSIGSDSFCGCTNLTSLSIGSGLKTISMYAFSGCSNLTDITISSENTTFTTENGALFMDNGKTLVCIPACPETYTIPDGVELICRSAFPTTLQTLVMPVSVKTIEYDVFYSGFTLTVNYKGSEEDRAKIIINTGNDNLTNATWVYNYVIGNKAAPDAIGDIVFSDGSAMAYTDFNELDETTQNEKKVSAVAVIFYVGTELNDGDDTTTSRTLGVGLKQQTGLAWCTSDANANSVNISTIQCMPSGGSEGAYTFETTADKNGSDNLSQIGTYLSSNSSSDDTGTEANYPAFYFAKNYASSSGNISKNSTFAENWYLPSFAELVVLYNSKSTVNGVLSLCEGTSFGSTGYWTSSQHTTAANASVLMFNMGIHTNSEKTNSTSFTTCVIREF